MKNLTLYDIPKDIINHILTFTDNTTFCNCLESCKLFNIKDFNLNCKDNYLEHKYILSGQTIPDLAEERDAEGIKFLVRKGVDINKRYNEGGTALYYESLYSRTNSNKIVINI